MECHDLESVYLATDYYVDALDRRLKIRIGQVSPILDDLLSGEGASTWAYITACNPKSKMRTEDENAERMRQLKDGLIAAGYVFFTGEGVGQLGVWPPEPSVLILCIGEPAALELARRYEQCAFVFGIKLHPPRLVWTGL